MGFKSFLSKVSVFTKSYMELCIWLLPFAITIRLLEAAAISLRFKKDFITSVQWNLSGLCYDISLFLRVSVCVLILFIIACFINEKISRIVLRTLQSLMLLLSLGLIVFFITSGFLLDKVLFSYSLKDAWGIVMASNESPFWVYIIVVALPILYFYLSGKRIKIHTAALVLFLILTFSSFLIFNNLTPSMEQYHVKVNKEHFFLKSIFAKRVQYQENSEEVVKEVKEFRSHFPELEFEDAAYPFLHQSVYNDVLSPFFNLKPEPPHLVFIVVEGMGYDLLKNDYQLMPFLDSLSAHSLSWENCLSVSSRTFGVLPALLGPLPLGKEGFLDLFPSYPEFHSLLSILHQNGYQNHFFYGGWVGFDKMGDFFDKNNGVYLQENDWDADIKNQQEKVDFWTWGYYDHLTYWQAHRKLKKTTAAPRVDVYLSVSTHGPWDYPKSSYFQNMVKNKVTQSKKLSEQQKTEILNQIHIYGCFAYSDWAVQQLMDEYKKRNDFENTIFIITGDHHAFAQQFAGYSNYHVPLMIYSPLLKSERKIKGVVSHRDITPTLISLLKNNYNIETPTQTAWLNRALDTSLTFNANTFSPLQLIDHSIGGVLYKNYLFCEGMLEELTDGASHKVTDQNIWQEMNRLMYLYQSLDAYILNNNALIKNPYAHVKLSNTAFSKKHTTSLSMDSTKLFLGLARFPIPDEANLLKVEIDFRYCIKKPTEGATEANTVLSIEKDDESGYYNSDYLTIDNQWHTYTKSVTIKKEAYNSLGKDCLLLIYIWNRCNLEGEVNNIKVKISTD